MRYALIALVLLVSPANALDCIPEPKNLTYGDPASDAWIRQCEAQFRNPLPTCYRLYNDPNDRVLCLAVIPKIDGYYATKPAPKANELKK